MKNRIFLGVLGGVLVFGMVAGPGLFEKVRAAEPGSVVINEVAWSGSVDSANDEWIELYNTGGIEVDLTGWTISDDNGASVYGLAGVIPPYGYFVVEDSGAAVNPDMPGMIVNLSLANTGDSLVLMDDAAQVIDSVNQTGGAWFAGDSVSYASMERINAEAAGDDPLNWADSSGAGAAATASLGSLITGTPGMLNSVSVPAAADVAIIMSASNLSPAAGEQVTIEVTAANADDMFSYGHEIVYNPLVLDLAAVSQGTFLSEGGVYATSFQYGLEDGVAGKLLIAEARTVEPKSGVDGTGGIYTLTFNVIGTGGADAVVVFGPESFVSSVSGEVSAQFAGVTLVVESSVLEPVVNLQAVEAAQRYSIQLSWDPVADAELYRVYRKGPHGDFVLLGETVSTLFVDGDAVAAGGKIIPNHEYVYQVAAVRGEVVGQSAEATGKETRGIKGDNNRSDRVDGRDLDNLARHFATDDSGAGFDPLVDTSYDGIADGNDLIDLGISFALTYQQ